MNATSTLPVIAMDSVESSQIAAIGHDATTNTLAIQFAPSRSGPGSTYHYANFTAELFFVFKAAESVGKYFYAHIKPHADKFPYTKIANTTNAA